MEFDVYCKANNIAPLCMPAHSSHLLQPLDVGCFGPLKRAYRREIENLMRSHITHVAKEDFLGAFRIAHQAAITKGNIEAGFRASGLTPLDPEAVLEKLDLRPRSVTPITPITPAAADPQTWISQTPKTVTEAGSQTEYIKARIARHQNSSPTSLYEAIDQFKKGTQGIIFQLSLLQSENHQLREANNRLSRRRKAKKSLLQKGGSLTVGGAQDLQAQRAVESQLAEETIQHRRRQPGANRTLRRCGNCRLPGHVRTACMAGREAFGESIDIAI